MAHISSRRTFVKQASLLFAATQAAPWLSLASAADTDSVIADTSAGKIRGLAVQDIKVFKGVPYGGTTAGKNRFMPPTKPAPWSGVRDAVRSGDPRIGWRSERICRYVGSRQCVSFNDVAGLRI